MIKKQKEAFTFMEALAPHIEEKWGKHWLNRIEGLINWKAFDYRMKRLYNLEKGRPARYCYLSA